MTVEAVHEQPTGQLQNASIPDPEEKDDLRADIVAAWDKHSQDGDTPTVAEETPSVPSSQRLRDPATGQFMKADGTVDPDQSPEPITDADIPQDKPQEPSPANEAPKGLSADMRAKWQTLDPSVQAEFVRREAAIDNGGRQWSEEKRAYEQQLAPLAEFAQRYQLDNGMALTRLLDWQRALEANPREAILQLAQLSGVNLGTPNQQQPQPVIYDPRVDGVAATVNSLLSTHIQSQIEAFKAAPGHEHFDKVSVEMGELMEKFPNKYPETSKGMEDAYQAVIWLNPEVRSALIQQQTAPQRQQQQVTRAKAAAMPKGSGPNGNAPAKGLDVSKMSDRDIVVAAAREHGWTV